MTRMMRIIESLSRFFGSASFPTFTLAVLLLYQGSLIALTFVPAADTGLGAFAADFRTWCLGTDPATGRTNWGYAIGMMAPPLFVGVAVAWLWWRPLATVRTQPLAAVRPLLAALVVAGTGVALVGLVGPQPARGELPFPAEALRTDHSPPPLRLTNQAGATVDLADLRGKVVLLTGVYASCVHTCPIVMAEAKSLVEDLTPEQRADVRVVAVTLDPGHDTPAVLATLAAIQGLRLPVWHLVTGEPTTVERTLDLMNIARARNPSTGTIDHANLFLLVDRRGRLAYRFTLGQRQARWLATAVRMLLGEGGHA